MNMIKALFMGLAFALLATVQAFAQQSVPTPGCKATPAELAATKQLVMDFASKTGEAKIALADPNDYVQHNPANHKRAEAEHLSDYEDFKKMFLAGGPGGIGGAATGPKPPKGNPTEMVVAECDVVIIVHKIFRQDPTAAPGTFYASYTFDAYRAKNGKIVEHWDNALITPPPAPAGRGQ